MKFQEINVQYLEIEVCHMSSQVEKNHKKIREYFNNIGWKARELD